MGKDRYVPKAKGKGKSVVTGRGREKTRSAKPTLIEDPALEDKVLTQQLREAGLYAANILGDGNCLFRALSDQLYGSPSMHLAIRHDICDYLSNNAERYRFFIDEDSVKGGFDGHVREMRQPGTYGTNIELSAFVARYRRPVKVYQPSLVYVLPVEEADSASGTGEASTSASPPPTPEPEDEPKLTPREKRLKAREERDKAKGKVSTKAKGKQPATQWKAPEPQPFDGTPLCIVYHSWEHYSSLRNLDGPHTGPPRLRMARVGSPQAESFTASPTVGNDEDEPEGDGAGVDEDVDMAEDDAASPAGDTPPVAHDPGGEPPLSLAMSKPAPSRRYGKQSDSKSLPSVRAALARQQAETASTSKPPSQLFPPAPHHLLPSILPPLPPSAPSSSPPTPLHLAGRASPRPPKHTLDRTRLRSHSSSSSSSSSGATSPLHPDDLASPSADGAEDVDENDNDSLHRRLRARRTEQSPALSTSTASTGVASASSGYSGASGGSGGTQASSPIEEEPKEVLPTSSSQQQKKDGIEDGFEDDEEEEVAVAPPSPADTGKKSIASSRPRRGPTAAEKKDLARQRRLERRRDKVNSKAAASAAAVEPRAGKTRTSKKGEKEGKEEEGRVLRSGRRTARAGDAGLAEIRELYI
ncbi:hypothetical protein JCM8547_001380 [Rhodosporidiobolus lusitaniae]